MKINKMKLSNKSSLKTPILFLVFNRLDTTKRVFAEIKKAKPKELFIASDGPRENKTGEKEKVEEIRKYLLDNICWKCEVKTLFRKENLGCKYAVSEAITWFFENVEQGIILEDDCLPDQSFFRFCQELLERYKDEEKIGSISGTNFIQRKTKDMGESYYFSRNFFIWGWATWKRGWQKQDLELKRYKEIEGTKKLKKIYPSFFERVIVKKRINDCFTNKINTWDIPWGIASQIDHSLCIIPKRNLIENIGLIQESYTNAKPNKIDSKYLFCKSEEIEFPLIHPKEIKPNKKFDKYFLKQEIKRLILKKFF